MITPLLWLLFALNLMGYFFLLSWTPTLMTAAKLPPTTVALAGAHASGRRHRGLAAAVLVAAAPPVSGDGDHVRDRRAGSRLDRFCRLTSQTALADCDFFAGFCVLGIQSGINVVGALVYPTRCVPTARDGSWASAASARSSGRCSVACSSACRSSGSICGRRCRSSPAPSSASSSIASTRRGWRNIPNCEAPQ